MTGHTTEAKQIGLALRVRHIDPHTDARWREFVTSHPTGSIYHHPDWIGALESEYSQPGNHLACERDDGQLVAVLPLLETRGVPLGLGGALTRRRLASLPRTPLAGPVSREPRATAMLLHEAVRLAGDSGALLQIKSSGQELEGLADGLKATPWRLTYVLELPEKPSPFRIPDAKERAKIKWAISKAAKSGVSVRSAETEGDLRKWYRVYLNTMRRSFVPPRPFRFFAAIWASLRCAGNMDLVLAECADGPHRKVVAGSIFFYFNETVSYSFSGLDRNYAPLRASDAILWHALNDATARGFRRFDFGEVPEGHNALAGFKTKWGAEPKRLYRYYWPAPDVIGGGADPGSGTLLSAVWSRLPLRVTEWIGDRVYSYL